MLWYGFAYFLFAFFMFFIIFVFFNKITEQSSSNKEIVHVLFVKTAISFYLYFSLTALFAAYLIFNCFSNVFLISNMNEKTQTIFFFENFFNLFAEQTSCLSFNLIQIYYFPFIYIFIIVTALSIIFCLSYSLNEIFLFSFYCTAILLAGYILFFTDSLIIFFLAYEMLLIPSFFILYKFAKTKRCVEASYLMFFWTQFGALFLIFSFLYLFFLTQSTSFWTTTNFQFSRFETNFLFFCWIIGFGVKLPIWPFYGWLPKAHVEASTNFSIFLSGVLVKFAFFGLFKCLNSLQTEPTLFAVFPFIVVGILDSSFKLFYQIDLKKLVAYSTVLEMHWLTLCVVSGQTPLILSTFCMLISHALLSTNSFLLVDAINRRFKTRLITEISSINFLSPKLFLTILLNLLIFLGFPGSIFFVAEFLFFSFFFDVFPFLTLFLLIFLYLLAPTFFFRSWLNVLFGTSQTLFKKVPLDLNGKELLLYNSIIALMFWLGFSWQIFIF